MASNTFRDFGPIKEKTASALVTSVTIQFASSGIFRLIHDKSLIAEAAAVTMMKAVSESLVTVKSASIPPELFNHWP